MGKATTAGMKAAWELLEMRAAYDSIPKKDADLDFLVDKVLIVLNILLPNEKKYTEGGVKSIRHRVRGYAIEIRDRRK